MNTLITKETTAALFLMISSSLLFAQEENSQTKKDTISTSIITNETSNVKNRDTKNRNVMLSAESATTPRQLNIGLPFAGDILILENDIPVVYTFWTQMPTTAWRYDSTLGRIGLMSFQDGALTYGKVGYIVTSWDREPGNKFKGFASLNTNNYGSLRYDASVSGPIGQKGWGYMIGFNETYERGSGVDFKFTPYQDRAEFFKAGITKKYKSGNVRLYYKYGVDKPIIGAYNPIVYEGDGKTKAIDGYKLGRDSYLPSDGLFPYYDYNTGAAKMGDLTSDEASKNITNAIYLTGEHRFKNGMKLNYSNMYMNSKAAFTIQYPISLQVSDPDQRTPGEVYNYAGTSNPYNGSVQLVSTQYYPQVEINTFISRAELTQKIKKHSLRLGATYQYYRAPEISQSGLYYQTVEANPQRLDRYQDLSAYGMGLYPVTKNGLLPSSGMGGYKINSNKKLALYFSDDIKVNKWLDFGFGARIERQNDHEIRSPYINQFVNGRKLVDMKFNNNWNKVGTANFVAKVTNEFGFLGDFTYNDWYTRYWDFANGEKDDNGTAIQTTPHGTHIKVMNVGGGIYWNHGELISLVSKVTRIKKENNIASQSIVNPANPTEQQTFYPIFYDISTIGWTTDIISKPFKNFNIHYLLTIQNPQYKNYSYSAYGVGYNYSNNVIPDLSKVLMEIDPSYFMMKGDLKLWLSLRYFGKQYGNPTNAFTYKGWWESFGGVNYKMNRNVDLGLQLVNIFNQTGIKGALVGADQITDASPYVGRKIVAGAIRPRTLEFSVNFKF